MSACKVLMFFALLTFFKLEFIYASKLQENARSSSISSDYAALRNDAQWIFQHLETITDSILQILPTGKASTDQTDNSTFVENTRLTLLLGLRHVLIGVKEISIAFQQKFTGDQKQQLQQLKAISRWFALLRSSLAELLRIYNQYIPEVLLGKCLGSYIVAAYPQRFFYEYPLLMLGEVFYYIMDYLQGVSAASSTAPPSNNEEDDQLSLEENEIMPAEIFPSKQQRLEQQEIILAQRANVSTAAILNRTYAWQKCFKIYAVDSISRQLKTFFLDDDG